MTARLDEWDVMGAEWRRGEPEASPISVEALRRTVSRRQRELMALYAGEAALTLGVIVFIVKMLRGGVNRGTVTATALILVWTAIVWAFSTWNRRGIWQPLAETTKEYLRLSRRRVGSGRRTVTFVRVSLVIYAVAYGTWFLVRERAVSETERLILLIAGVYCSLMLAWSVWYTRRLSRDLRHIESIELSLGLCDAA